MPTPEAGAKPLAADVWQACAFEQFMVAGRTRPALLTCRRQPDSGGAELRLRAVVKAVGHPEVTAKSLVLDYAGARLARAFGCTAPEPLLVEITPEFLAATADNYASVGCTLSAGMAFGSAYEEHALEVFPNSTPKFDRLQAAARAYAFDMTIQNVDRRREKPNCFISAQTDELTLIDFEKAFTFLVPLIGLSPEPWQVSRFGFHRDHLFYSWLKGQPIDWWWVSEALDAAVTAAEEIDPLLPVSWAADMQPVVEHLWCVRHHDAAFVDELKASLK